MNSIRTDLAKRIMRVTIHGMASEEAYDALRRDLVAATAVMRRHGQQFHCLLDLREASVLPQNLTQGAQRLTVFMTESGVDRTAILCGSRLQGLQVKRLYEADRFQCFYEEEDAARWLED